VVVPFPKYRPETGQRGGQSEPGWYDDIVFAPEDGPEYPSLWISHDVFVSIIGSSSSPEYVDTGPQLRPRRTHDDMVRRLLIAFLQTGVCLFYRSFYRVRVYGLDRLPQRGPFIVAANHVTVHDPILLGAFLHPGIRFMAKAELFEVPGLGHVIRRFGAFPVRRQGIGIGAVRHAIRLLGKGQVVGIFPEGTRSRTGALLPAKPGVGFIAVRSGVPIVPVAISFNPRRLFRRHFIVVGEPIHLTEALYTNYRLLSQRVMDRIGELAQIEQPVLGVMIRT
jgi:1-acyl-sn-glycerol-3-phosphate acyltransferase